MATPFLSPPGPRLQPMYFAHTNPYKPTIRPPHSLFMPHPAWLQTQQHRLHEAHRLAQKFYAATVEKRLGTDEEGMLSAIKKAQHKGLIQEFQAAVMQISLQKTGKARTADNIIQSELTTNPLEKWFKNAPRKEALDYLRFGQNTYTGSGTDYRLYGMYRSLADFWEVCKSHPLMSAGVIGGVAWAGGKWKFLGGISGIAVMLWGLGAALLHEVQASKAHKTKAQKAKHYQASGENLSAFLITAIGAKGITEGTKNGVQAYQKAIQHSKTLKPSLMNHVKATGKAIAYTDPPGQAPKLNWMEHFLFVSGLFDNVLLPFNWVADRLEKKPKA